MTGQPGTNIVYAQCVVDVFDLLRSFYGCPCVYMEGHYILLGVLSFFRTLSSVVTARNLTKHCHMFRNRPDLKISSEIWGGSLPQNMGP